MLINSFFVRAPLKFEAGEDYWAYNQDLRTCHPEIEAAASFLRMNMQLQVEVEKK